MKNSIFFLIATISIFLISCEDDSDKTNYKELTLIKTVPGGCNVQDVQPLKILPVSYHDTVIFTAKDDTLNIFAGINYICCAPFTSSTNIDSNTLVITLSDTCNVDDDLCYCRCMCYYTWDFKFLSINNKDYYFKVVLNDPRQSDIQIIMEGKVNI